MPGLTPVSSEKASGGLMRMFTRKTNKLQPKFEMTGERRASLCVHMMDYSSQPWHHMSLRPPATANGPPSA